MTDEQHPEKQPLSMTRRYRRGLILTGVLCVLAMLAATVLFQRSYTERVDKLHCPDLRQIRRRLQGPAHPRCHDPGSHAAESDVACTLRFTLIDGGGTVLFDSKTSALVYDKDGTVYAVMDSNLPNHADRPEFRRAMAEGQRQRDPRERDHADRDPLLRPAHRHTGRYAGAARGRGHCQHLGPERRHPAAALRARWC